MHKLSQEFHMKQKRWCWKCFGFTIHLFGSCNSCENAKANDEMEAQEKYLAMVRESDSQGEVTWDMGTSISTSGVATRTGVVIAVCITKYLGCHGVPYCFANGTVHDQPSRYHVGFLLDKYGVGRVFEHECMYCQSVKRGLKQLEALWSLKYARPQKCGSSDVS